MDVNQRRAVVADLVGIRKPVEQAAARLREFPWDSDEELVVLGPAEMRAALRKFIDGTISASDLEAWANAVEGRDDIRFEPAGIIDLITEIANPILFSPITIPSMRALLARIDELSTR